MRQKQDHPRRCGENICANTARQRKSGSPPQVRGKLLYKQLPRHPERITPAGAGKTIPRALVCFVIKDHPRRCGENSNSYNLHDVAWGSPPQVRGKLLNSGTVLGLCRITPAGAGKTYVIFSQVSGAQDHPRRCGENAPGEGSVVTYSRITPAGAGKTKLHFPNFFAL